MFTYIYNKDLKKEDKKKCYSSKKTQTLAQRWVILDRMPAGSISEL